MLLEGFDLRPLRGDLIVEGAEAVGDAVLFYWRGNWYCHLLQVSWAEVLNATTYCGSLRLVLELWAFQKYFQIAPLQLFIARSESNETSVKYSTGRFIGNY